MFGGRPSIATIAAREACIFCYRRCSVPKSAAKTNSSFFYQVSAKSAGQSFAAMLQFHPLASGLLSASICSSPLWLPLGFHGCTCSSCPAESCMEGRSGSCPRFESGQQGVVRGQERFKEERFHPMPNEANGSGENCSIQCRTRPDGFKGKETVVKT